MKSRDYKLRPLLFFTPLFSVVYNQERLIYITNNLGTETGWPQNLRFIIESGFKSRAVCSATFRFLSEKSRGVVMKNGSDEIDRC